MNKRQVRANLKRKAKTMLKDVVANLDNAMIHFGGFDG